MTSAYVPRRVEVDKDALAEIQRRTSLPGEAPDFPRAACRGRSREMFPETTKEVAAAKAICASCLERPGCLEYGVSLPCWTLGVWGGLTQVERERLRVSRRRAAELEVAA